MAGPYVKTTMHFILDRQSFSESYLLLNDSTIGSGVRTKAGNLARARLLMMGGNVGLQAVIMSVEEKPANPATTGDSVPLQLSSISTRGNPVLASHVEPALTGVKAEPGDECMRSRCRGSDNNHTKMIFFAGCPARLFTTTPPGPDLDSVDAGKWVQAFTAFAAILSKGEWGFWARLRTGGAASPQNVVAVQQSTLPSGYWGVVTTTTGQLLNVGETVQLKGFRHTPTNQCKWQGMWTISQVDTTSLTGLRIYYLFNSQALSPTIISKMGTVQAVQYTGIPIAEVDTPVQGRRKRGVGYAAPRGRSRRRPCCAPS